MQRIDVLIVAALVVAAAGSAIGIATYEDDRRAFFHVAWSTSDEPVEAALDGDAAELVGTVNVTATNVTRAVWTVTVTGAPARVQPVPMRVEVTAPDNTTASGEAELPAGPTASVEVPVEVALVDVPEAEVVTGSTLDDARARLASTMTTRNGTGTWTIRVLVSQGGPLPAEQVSVEISGVLTTYAATLSPQTPKVSRG